MHTSVFVECDNLRGNELLFYTRDVMLFSILSIIASTISFNSSLRQVSGYKLGGDGLGFFEVT